MNTTLLMAVLLGLVGSACSSPAKPTVTPTSHFAILSASPPFGGTANGRGPSDLLGTQNLTVTFQITADAVPAHFVVELLNGATECLRTQLAYSEMTARAGNTFTYSSSFFLRDNQQPSCGSKFSTDRARLVLQDAGSATLLTEDVSGGWTFAFQP